MAESHSNKFAKNEIATIWLIPVDMALTTDCTGLAGRQIMTIMYTGSCYDPLLFHFFISLLLLPHLPSKPLYIRIHALEVLNIFGSGSSGTSNRPPPPRRTRTQQKQIQQSIQYTFI